MENKEVNFIPGGIYKLDDTLLLLAMVSFEPKYQLVSLDGKHYCGGSSTEEEIMNMIKSNNIELMSKCLF